MGRDDDHRASKWAERQRRSGRQSRRGRGVWAGRLEALGLRIEEQDRSEFSARGRSKSTEVRVKADRHDGEWIWTLTAHNKHIDPDIAVVPEAGVAWLSRTFGPPEQVLGDPALDEVAHVHGPRDQLLAGLGAPARERLRRLIDRGGAVTDRTVRLVLASRDPRPAWLPERARDVGALAVNLAVPRNKLVSGLIRAAGRDPLPGIRHEALRLLLDAHPQHVPSALLTEPALLDLLDALDGEGLVVALRALGRIGTATSLARIAPHARFPRGNNASRKAAKHAGRDVAARTAPEGGLAVLDTAPSATGRLAMAREAGGLATGED